MFPWIFTISLQSTRGRSVLLSRRCFHKHTSRVRRTLSSQAGAEPNKTDQDDGGDNTYDVVISGGGMVGSAMAAALGSERPFSGSRILLIEAAPYMKLTGQLSETYGNRVCALTPGTKELLESFGAWETICSMRKQTVRRMQVWEACSDAMITFDKDNMAADLAYIVENNVILTAIVRQLETTNVEVMYSAKVESYELPKPHQHSNYKDSLATLHLSDGREIKTRLVVGADGINSLLRKTMEVKNIEWNYDQMGVVATLIFSEPTENNVAWQRFLPTGPVAILPLTDTMSSLIWTTTTDRAKELLDMTEETFVDSLNTALWDESQKNSFTNTALNALNVALSFVKPEGGTVRQLPPHVVGIQGSSRAAFPLGLGHAVHYSATRAALIGDAAHRVHPLAGQGVNLGFGDVACLRENLISAKNSGCDIGDLAHLMDYESERQLRVLPVMATVDGLNRLYGTSLAPAVMLRSLGLQATNALKPLKDFIVSQGSKAI